jgi:very-short-patch-repair endonuclease
VGATRSEAGSSRRLQDRIASVAARQHGVVTRSQLMGLGLSRSAIARSLEAGRFQLLHRGVYLVGLLKPLRATEMAAVLAGGPKARISHTSAACLWRMGPVEPPSVVHVSVPGGGRGRRPGIHFQRVIQWADDESTAVDGIPVTSPARTLVDLGGMIGSRELERAVAFAMREGLVDSEELGTLPERYPRRPGMASLRSLLRDLEGPSLTRSEAERCCLDLLQAAGLPRPHSNVPVGPYELDLFWPDHGVAIEIDGRAHHSSRPRFEGDRRKDMWLRVRGIQVIRLSWRQITRDAVASAVQVGQVLALARAQQPPPRGTGPDVPMDIGGAR